MKIPKPARGLTGVLASAWIAGVLLASQSSAIARGAQETADKRQQDATSAKSKQVFEALCAACHPLEDVTSARKTRSQWEETIDTMIANGATGTEADFATALAYLIAVYGRVNVNKAPAGEIAEVLELPAKDADAIVKYREDKGKFEDFDALTKVPGLDLEKLTKKKAAISY
jgi:competence ComEA-like helix-hairpin-helix protein